MFYHSCGNSTHVALGYNEDGVGGWMRGALEGELCFDF
jgi:hypothetical protein